MAVWDAGGRPGRRRPIWPLDDLRALSNKRLAGEEHGRPTLASSKGASLRVPEGKFLSETTAESCKVWQRGSAAEPEEELNQQPCELTRCPRNLAGCRPQSGSSTACGNCRNLIVLCKPQQQFQSSPQPDLTCVLQRVQSELDETVFIREEAEAS